VPAKPSYARGNPLTHSVTFTDMSGTCWLVYVEPAPPEPALWPNAAVIPGRRLRFDSVDRSVTVSPFPAGAPFLQERTLQILLDQTQTRTTVAATPSPAPAERATTPVAPARPVATAPRRTISPKAVAPVEPPAEPMRDQLASVVSSRSGVTYQLSRLVQPFALVLMVIKDMILPRGRG
jgi:septal ring-binding cell division protein DamX